MITDSFPHHHDHDNVIIIMLMIVTRLGSLESHHTRGRGADIHQGLEGGKRWLVKWEKGGQRFPVQIVGHCHLGLSWEVMVMMVVVRMMMKAKIAPGHGVEHSSLSWDVRWVVRAGWRGIELSWSQLKLSGGEGPPVRWTEAKYWWAWFWWSSMLSVLSLISSSQSTTTCEKKRRLSTWSIWRQRHCARAWFDWSWSWSMVMILVMVDDNGNDAGDAHVDDYDDNERYAMMIFLPSGQIILISEARRTTRRALKQITSLIVIIIIIIKKRWS